MEKRVEEAWAACQEWEGGEELGSIETEEVEKEGRAREEEAEDEQEDQRTEQEDQWTRKFNMQRGLTVRTPTQKLEG